MSSVSFIDSSGLHAIEDIKSELRSYGGSGDKFRFVGLTEAVRRRFKRAVWPLASPYDDDQETPVDGAETSPDYAFDSLPHAIRMPTLGIDNAPELGPLAWEKDDVSIINGGQLPALARDWV
jgi:sodium-independent sulfate anion transporter 11